MAVSDIVSVVNRQSIMVASENFHAGILESRIENLPNDFSVMIDSQGNIQRSNSVQSEKAKCENICVENNDTRVLGSNTGSDTSCRMGPEITITPSLSMSNIHNNNNMQDSVSIASTSSAFSSSCSSSCSSSTSSLASMNVSNEFDRRQNTLSIDPRIIKVFSPANKNESNKIQNPQTPSHPRIRRVPSTANPKYRVPNLRRTQRSKSQPHIQVNALLNQRRNSYPINIGTPMVNVHSAKNLKQHHPAQPNFNKGNAQQPKPQQQQFNQQELQSQQQQQPQQQIIYLQIPQPSQSQIYDPQVIQQQISSQLQTLVPQIYSQLLNQITVNPIQNNTTKVQVNQSNSRSNSEANNHVKDQENPSLNSSFTGDVQSQRVMNQMFQQSAPPKNSQILKTQNSQIKRQKQNMPPRQSNLQKAPSVESLNEIEDPAKTFQLNNLCQIIQQIPPHILQQNQAPSYLEIQQLPGYPKITIPITQELILQCQQLQAMRDPGFVPYQPRLETILEESFSVKQLKMTRFSKTKLIACILTILCVIVVALLAGDKTVAVVVVSSVFIIFLLASVFYLYVNSTRNQISTSMTSLENPRLQVSSLPAADKLSSPV